MAGPLDSAVDHAAGLFGSYVDTMFEPQQGQSNDLRSAVMSTPASFGGGGFIDYLNNKLNPNSFGGVSMFGGRSAVESQPLVMRDSFSLIGLNPKPLQAPVQNNTQVRQGEAPQTGGNWAPNVIAHKDLIQQVANEEGVPFEVLAGLVDIENGSQSPTVVRSDTGAAGLMQVTPNQGVPYTTDPLGNLRAGAQLLKNKQKALRIDPNDWDSTAAAYFGAYNPQRGVTGDRDATGTSGYDYVNKFKSAKSKYAQQQGAMDGAVAGAQAKAGVMVPQGQSSSYWTSGGTHGGHPAADIFAPKGSPILAPVGGTVQSMSTPLGGNSAILHGDDGRYYYLAHGNVPFINGRVAAGQQIGQVGNTGNAASTAPHLHLGIASDPKYFDMWNGSGDIAGTPALWGMG